MQAWSTIGPLVGVVVGALLAALFQWKRDTAQAERDRAKDLRQASRDTILAAVAAAQDFKSALHTARLMEFYAESARRDDPERDVSALFERADETKQASFEAATRLSLLQQTVRASVSLELAKALDDLRGMARRLGPPDDPEAIAQVRAERPWLWTDHRPQFDLEATIVSAGRRLETVETIARHLLGVTQTRQ